MTAVVLDFSRWCLLYSQIAGHCASGSPPHDPHLLSTEARRVKIFETGFSPRGTATVNRGHVSRAIAGYRARLGATLGGSDTWSRIDSRIVQRCFVNPAAIAGVRQR
jgi:hypothetical protein